MNGDFLKNIITKEAEQNAQRSNAEKRKKHFQNLGRKGGLIKKSDPKLTRVISFRVTEDEYQIEAKKAAERNLKLSTFARMVYQERELKIKEFETEKLLYTYGNNFTRIKNLLRHREWNVFKNKSKIINEIELVLKLIREYLDLKMEKNT